jgi:nitrogenase molybdenum-iron protein alpha/beta subunit
MREVHLPRLPDVPGTTTAEFHRVSCAQYHTQMAVGGMGRDVAYVVHGDRACGNVFKNNVAEARAPMYSTMLSETDMVYGGADRLLRTLRQAVGDGARAVFVLSTCPSQLIGDDVGSVAAQVERETDVPIFPMDTCGMVYRPIPELHDDVLAALATRVMEPREVEPRTVNFLGYEAAWDDRPGRNVDALRSLLAGIGVRLNACLPAGATTDDVLCAPAAALNVLRYFDSTRRTARAMAERFGTPFVAPPPPVGVAGTARFLRDVAGALGIDAEDAIARTEVWATAEIARARRGFPERLHAGYYLNHETHTGLIGIQGDLAADLVMLDEAGFDVTLLCISRPEIRDTLAAHLETILVPRGIGVRAIYYSHPPDLRRILADPSLVFDVCFNTRSNKRYLREAGHPYLEPPARDGVQPYYGFEGAVRMAHGWLKVANQRFFRKYAAYTGDAA